MCKIAAAAADADDVFCCRCTWTVRMEKVIRTGTVMTSVSWSVEVLVSRRSHQYSKMSSKSLVLASNFPAKRYQTFAILFSVLSLNNNYLLVIRGYSLTYTFLV